MWDWLKNLISDGFNKVIEIFGIAFNWLYSSIFSPIWDQIVSFCEWLFGLVTFDGAIDIFWDVLRGDVLQILNNAFPAQVGFGDPGLVTYLNYCNSFFPVEELFFVLVWFVKVYFACLLIKFIYWLWQAVPLV